MKVCVLTSTPCGQHRERAMCAPGDVARAPLFLHVCSLSSRGAEGGLL